MAHLFGEAASGRRGDGEISLTPVLPEFSCHPDYRFQIGEGIMSRTGATSRRHDRRQGKCRIQIDLRRFAGRAYRLSVLFAL